MQRPIGIHPNHFHILLTLIKCTHLPERLLLQNSEFLRVEPAMSGFRPNEQMGFSLI